jgi:hypothetical protein
MQERRHVTRRTLIYYLRVFDLDSGDDVGHLLCTPHHGLYVPPGNIVNLSKFAPGTVAAVLCSHEFEDADYIYPSMEVRV